MHKERRLHVDRRAADGRVGKVELIGSHRDAVGPEHMIAAAQADPLAEKEGQMQGRLANEGDIAIVGVYVA